MRSSSARRILVAPLDWGLGHTTRCIPIIRRLLAYKHEVLFAGNDRQQTFIKNVFSDKISYQHLDGYNISYKPKALIWGLIRQIPDILWKIRKEHKWLYELAKNEQIDGIISDNRYGLYHHEIPSVILTHQAQVKTGFGAVADKFPRRLHYRLLERFSECWLVDVPGKENLSGELANPDLLPVNSLYIGWLSQFDRSANQVKSRHLLILLSGPEPARTLLSNRLWAQVIKLEVPVVFVEGNPTANRQSIPSHVQYHPRIGGALLKELLEGAEIVICRSGYSTIMDLVRLQKRAILIPTPGQTEQEYLAKYLMSRRMFLSKNEKDLLLIDALKEAKQFPFLIPDTPGAFEMFVPVLNEWIQRLNATLSE